MYPVSKHWVNFLSHCIFEVNLLNRVVNDFFSLVFFKTLRSLPRTLSIETDILLRILVFESPREENNHSTAAPCGTIEKSFNTNFRRDGTFTICCQYFLGSFGKDSALPNAMS